MDILTPEKPEESTAIVTAGQYSQEIRRTPALPPLSKEDMASANELAKSLIRSEDHLEDIVTFGSDTQSAAAQITRDMLAGVRVGALDDVIHLSDDVLTQVHSLDVSDLLPSAHRFLGVFEDTVAAVRHRIKEFFRRYQLVNARLDRQEAEIFAKVAVSTDRYYRDKTLADLTLKTLLDARIKVEAIQLFLDGEHGHAETQRRLQAVNEDKAAAQAENRSMDFLKVAAADRHAKYIERLEMKETALRQLILSTYHMNCTLRMMGDNENIIRQRLSDIRTDLLPQWRTMIAVAYQAYEQQEIAKLVDNLRIAESNLRRQSADQIEATAQNVADLMLKPTIDLAAMKYYQDKLTDSLNTLKTASMEARKTRDMAEENMQGLMNEMNKGVADISLRKE